MFCRWWMAPKGEINGTVGRRIICASLAWVPLLSGSGMRCGDCTIAEDSDAYHSHPSFHRQLLFGSAQLSNFRGTAEQLSTPRLVGAQRMFVYCVRYS